MKEIARFYDPEEAQIAAGFLRAQGLEIHLADELALNSLPNLRVGLGGYRLMAEERDANIARRYLADIDGEDHGPACAQCGVRKLRRSRDPTLALLLLPFLELFPFARAKRHLRCAACGHKQPDPDEKGDR
jgi:DNA-directed RNA polymerase subunit RPC12/RpoP